MSAAAGTTKKVRKSRAAKAQAQQETKQEYVKAEQGEDSSTPPLVVYPQTLVPSSVLDMISTPQHGKSSNGVRFTSNHTCFCPCHDTLTLTRCPCAFVLQGPASLQLNAIFIWPKAVRALLVDPKR
jgi:hypothetical protein